MIPTIEHAGALDDLVELPAYLAPDHATGQPPSLLYSCAFCGVGDGGRVATTTTATADGVPAALGRLRLVRAGVTVELPATVDGETLLVLADERSSRPTRSSAATSWSAARRVPSRRA